MIGCTLWSYNAKEAARYGKEITAIQHAILAVSDPLTHSELQFMNRSERPSFSATIQDGDSGVRFKNIEYSHRERWVALSLSMTEEQERRAWDYAHSIEGAEYDLIGVISLASKYKIIKPDPDKYWCSEAVGGAIKAAYRFGNDFQPEDMHPVRLFFEMYWRVIE